MQGRCLRDGTQPRRHCQAQCTLLVQPCCPLGSNKASKSLRASARRPSRLTPSPNPRLAAPLTASLGNLYNFFDLRDYSGPTGPELAEIRLNH